MKNSFKNKFPQYKKYLPLAEVSEIWEKTTSTSQKNQFHEKK